MRTSNTLGHRLFLAATIILLLFSIVQLAAIYKNHVVGPTNDLERGFDRAARELKFDFGPFQSSGWHAFQHFSTSYSALLI